MHPDHGYGFMLEGITYIYDEIEGAEKAAAMAQGYGGGVDGKCGRYWDIYIYPYFNGVKAISCGARSVMTSDGMGQCAY